MAIDQPLTVYKRDKDDGTSPSSKKEHQPTPEQMRDVVRKWKERKAKGEGVNLSDFLGSDAIKKKPIKQ